MSDRKYGTQGRQIKQDWLDFFAMPDAPPRTARLFRNGRNQAVRLPKEMDMGDTEEVLIYRVGSRLVIEPKRPSWSALMDTPDVGDDFLSERPMIGIEPDPAG
ncbi:type II toxin-antitoxin system VapB family antitoxin [Spectribacter hydrogenoxidans]|uniref:Type II toxin-antitoxin system VapB family antitoxin n=1 Tax=Spectribacter hydrogenoxidans TaxID=3075608 RepID=A0ABU3BZY6_9GAMM|nr:type II toxin-antitoxin system VapB family antitoxin [Salinisphaera sp. W335]MDT0634873.1 type II toxin-antitoxin system VapB family antitoxin [Salinisphaera sp. W335]